MTLNPPNGGSQTGGSPTRVLPKPKPSGQTTSRPPERSPQHKHSPLGGRHPAVTGSSRGGATRELCRDSVGSGAPRVIRQTRDSQPVAVVRAPHLSRCSTDGGKQTSSSSCGARAMRRLMVVMSNEMTAWKLEPGLHGSGEGALRALATGAPGRGTESERAASTRLWPRR